MSKEAIDPIQAWFVAGEELGEYIGIRFGHIPPGATKPEWTFFPHTDYDGIGGLAELLRRGGAELTRLPRSKHPSSPSVLSVIRALPKYLKPRQRVKWGKIERGAVISSSASQPPLAVGWHLFDETTTSQIRRVCRSGAFTVNSFLLKHLTKAIRPFLEDESSMVPWMIPVNLRGKVTRDRDTANHSSYVGVKVRSYETVHDIHRNIYNALGRGEHFANWSAYKTGNFLSLGMRKYLIVKEQAMSQWNLGGFSNLGDWDSEKKITQPDCEGGWFFCPPVLRCQCVGAGCVTYQNRLSLTIQAHPDLTTDSAVTQTWIQHWVREIEVDLPGVLSQPVAMPIPWLAA